MGIRAKSNDVVCNTRKVEGSLGCRDTMERGQEERGGGKRRKKAGGEGRRGESWHSRIHRAIMVRVWGGEEGNKLQDAP